MDYWVDDLSFNDGRSFYGICIALGSVTLVSEQLKLELTTLRKDIQTDGRHAEVEYIDQSKLIFFVLAASLKKQDEK